MSIQMTNQTYRSPFFALSGKTRETVSDLAISMLDMVVAGLVTLVLSPLLLILAIWIKATSKGPIIFRQTRVGLGGQTFTMYKFRSMRQDAEELLTAVAADSQRDGVCFKLKRDPRVTCIGAVMRRFSMDELPQLFNVLKGDMSLVGPRPALIREVEAYDFKAMRRLEVKPGITGIWQVSGRADVSFERMIDMDLRYVRSRSFSMNIKCLLLTFQAVVGGRGAY